MKTQNFNELIQTIQPLFMASEKSELFMLDVKFHPDGETTSSKHTKTTSKIERYVC